MQGLDGSMVAENLTKIYFGGGGAVMYKLQHNLEKLLGILNEAHKNFYSQSDVKSREAIGDSIEIIKELLKQAKEEQP